MNNVITLDGNLWIYILACVIAIAGLITGWMIKKCRKTWFKIVLLFSLIIVTTVISVKLLDVGTTYYILMG